MKNKKLKFVLIGVFSGFLNGLFGAGGGAVFRQPSVGEMAKAIHRPRGR